MQPAPVVQLWASLAWTVCMKSVDDLNSCTLYGMLSTIREFKAQSLFSIPVWGCMSHPRGFCMLSSGRHQVGSKDDPMPWLGAGLLHRAASQCPCPAIGSARLEGKEEGQVKHLAMKAGREQAKVMWQCCPQPYTQAFLHVTFSLLCMPGCRISAPGVTHGLTAD